MLLVNGAESGRNLAEALPTIPTSIRVALFYDLRIALVHLLDRLAVQRRVRTRFLKGGSPGRLVRHKLGRRLVVGIIRFHISNLFN